MSNGSLPFRDNMHFPDPSGSFYGRPNAERNGFNVKGALDQVNGRNGDLGISNSGGFSPG